MKLLPLLLLSLGCSPNDPVDHTSGDTPPIDPPNRPPVVESLTFVPMMPEPADSIEAQAIVTDPDGDTPTVSFAWTLPGRPTILGSTLPAQETRAGDVWTVTISVTDPEGASTSKMLPVHILGEIPLPTLTLEPPHPLEQTHDLRCSWSWPANFDPSTLTVDLSWQVDGKSHLPGEDASVVPASLTNGGQHWTCTLQVSSGESERSLSVETWVERPAPVELASTTPGRFRMGVDPSGMHYNGKNPWHEVVLTRPFWIARTETTHAEFSSRMGYDPRLVDPWCPADDCTTCPVEQLTWHQAVAYANAMSRAIGVPECFTCTGDQANVRCDPMPTDPVGCLGFRLPTLAEWEYAARSGGTIEGVTPLGGTYYQARWADVHDACLWPWLEDAPSLTDQAWWRCSYPETTGCDNDAQPVAQLLPNELGLYDVLGNAPEWVLDAQRPSWGDATDPLVMTTALLRDGHVRGGSHRDHVEKLDVGYVGGAVGWDDPVAGIRLVRTRHSAPVATPP